MNDITEKAANHYYFRLRLAEERIQELEEVLRFYANEENWKPQKPLAHTDAWVLPMQDENGERARQVLERGEKE